MNILKNKEDASSRDPVCIFLTDQNFTPILPTNGPGSCPIIIRIEDGSLSELLAFFRRLLGNQKLAVGSTILISSMSHLGRAGLAAYAEDLVDILAKIESDYGGRVRALHGVPLPSTTITDPVLARSLWDLHSWLEEADPRAHHHLCNSSKFFKNRFLSSDKEAVPINPMATLLLPYRLPVSTRKPDKVLFTCNGSSNLQSSIPILSGTLEIESVANLLSEINSELALNLDCEPDLDRPYVGKSTPHESGPTIVVGGGSHAARIAIALMKNNKRVIDLSRPGWLPTREAVDSLADGLRDVLSSDACTQSHLVILQLYHNAIYHSIGEDGTINRPTKEGGIYHIL